MKNAKQKCVVKALSLVLSLFRMNTFASNFGERENLLFLGIVLWGFCSDWQLFKEIRKRRQRTWRSYGGRSVGAEKGEKVGKGSGQGEKTGAVDSFKCTIRFASYRIMVNTGCTLLSSSTAAAERGEKRLHHWLQIDFAIEIIPASARVTCNSYCAKFVTGYRRPYSVFLFAQTHTRLYIYILLRILSTCSRTRAHS